VAAPGVELEQRSALPARRSSSAGLVLCLVSGVSFGLAAVLAKEAFRSGMTVPTLLAGRFGLAAVVFWLIVARRRRLPPSGHSSGRLSGRHLATAVGLGAIGYAVQSACYFTALTRLNASVVAQLLYVYPSLVVIIAVLRRREVVDRRTVVALVASALGLVLLLRAGGGAGALAVDGVLLALGAAITYAAYITVAAGLPADFDVYLLSAIVCTAATVTLGGYGLATGSLRAPVHEVGWLWLGLLAAVPTVVAIVTFLGGLRLVGGSVAAILSCVEPVVTAVSAMAVFGEGLTPMQVVGAAAVLAAVVVLRWRRG
jgi:drug/metabolite transporter (DMT)-like permease